MTQVKVFTAEETAKIKRLKVEGVDTLREIDDLKGGLKDTVDAIAKELQVKPSELNKALKTAYKGDYQDQEDEREIIETILATMGEI